MSAPIYNLKGKRVWVAGHNGMVGSALLRRLEREGCTLITAPHQALDLTRQADVELEMFGAGKPEIIEWRLMKGALTGIGLLRYDAGELSEGGGQDLVYTAIVDLQANKVVATEPFSWGRRRRIGTGSRLLWS